MSRQSFSLQDRTIGRFAAWAVSLLEMAYLATLTLGLLSLPSPQDSIGDPYFSILESLIILIAPLMVMSMVAVQTYAAADVKGYSSIALALTIVLTGITSSIHFVILTVSRQLSAAGCADALLFFSFQWPSVAYALDILAWDWFFPLSMFFVAPALGNGRLETTVRVLAIVSGVLSLSGLIGVPLADMQIRMVGVLGYAVVSPIVFLLLGILLGRDRQDL